jgi:putative SOS response-associated peptidase YedK
MCGRYLLYADAKLVERAFGIEEFSFTPHELMHRFAIAPSQLMPVVRSRPPHELRVVRRGGRTDATRPAASWISASDDGDAPSLDESRCFCPARAHTIGSCRGARTWLCRHRAVADG